MLAIEIKNWKKDESINRIVKACFPSYNKRKVYVRATETVTFHDLNWSGGTRNEYVGCTLTGVVSGDMSRFNALAPWDARQVEGKSIPLPVGHVIVRGGHFCGNETVLTIYVNPADMPKHLEQAS